MSHTAEPPDNIAYVFAQYAPRPDARYQAMPPRALVGCYVKRAFGTLTGALEHMWVHIDGVTPDGHLVGRLNNHPVHDCGVVSGDVVPVRLDQIEAVCR